ncbi:hypothetical protein H6G33_15475 [Calothrix sp. FACHB-1219]|uniref:hypothetical protein n=1 Tax=unclassified Calothrix TaxID=2619626 RepID=UPI001683C608|nr:MULTISPECIES: hypothetical protein [unclassified Calothrix]MBD2207388.1 hypothetical protein [Calothrix sp. FACHB-168]MBD2218435.1 hypothetical protein [Calothrix sp. FACHB-1219]
MTRLLNLESYIECCQYSQLFDEPLQPLVPSPEDLPREYKKLLQKYFNHPYIQEPIINANFPQELTINRNNLDYLLVGTELTQAEKQRLFIIRDTVDLMTLSMSNFLEHRDGYLYSSAYHYWNYYSQISHQSINKSLIFVELDNFSSFKLIPLDLSCRENSPYKIPILNTKNAISCKQSYNPQETYQNICKNIATKILSDNFPALANNVDTVNHLTSYLQKISLVKILQPNINQENINFVTEILYNRQIFYKRVTISIAAIANIVSSTINIQSLRRLASQHPQYQFVLVSQYNIFADIQQQLPEFICLNPLFQEFHQIWEKKLESNFPLFGIYLDQIEFAIGIPDSQGRVSRQWIQLSNPEDAISYEGDRKVLIGNIPSLDQNFFRIKNKIANLPIKVNGEDYSKHGIPQDYKIEIKDYEGNEDVRIGIEFHLQPGSFPELKVTDIDGKYNNINTFLADRIKTSYSYIPPAKITSTRQQESLNQIDRLQKYQDFIEFNMALLNLSKELDTLSRVRFERASFINLNDLLSKASRIINKNSAGLYALQLINTASNQSVVSELNEDIKNTKLHRIVDIVIQLINLSNYTQLNTIQKNCLNTAVIFIGKFYYFSENILKENLFDIKIFNKINKIQYPTSGNEYLQLLAKVAINLGQQDEYFNWFHSFYKLENNKYLWGYSRILLWYYKFDFSVNSLNYQEHFSLIMEYLLSKPHTGFDYTYKQNAFLSLLYLLSFREHDKIFCQDGSIENLTAKRVIEHFKQDRIILRQVSSEKPLNQYFQEMIEGTATEDDLNNIVQA